MEDLHTRRMKKSLICVTPKLGLNFPYVDIQPRSSLLVPTKASRSNSTAYLKEMLPNIFLGDSKTAWNQVLLKSHKITHIINCVSCQIPDNFPDTFKYLNLHMHDNETFTFLHELCKAIYFIIEVLNMGKRVFVHCAQGKSRSPTIIMGYKMWKKHSTLNEVLTEAKMKSPIIDPNFGFLCQLSLWQKILTISEHHKSTALLQTKGFFEFYTDMNQKELVFLLESVHFGIIMESERIVVLVNPKINMKHMILKCEVKKGADELVDNGIKLARLIQRSCPWAPHDIIYMCNPSSFHSPKKRNFHSRVPTPTNIHKIPKPCLLRSSSETR